MAKALAGVSDSNASRVGIIDANVSAALSDNEAAYVMGVARSNSSDAGAVIQEREPIAKRLHPIRLHRRGIDDFQRIEGEIRTAQILSRDRIEICGSERLETGMDITRMIQYDDL